MSKHKKEAEAAVAVKDTAGDPAPTGEQIKSNAEASAVTAAPHAEVPAFDVSKAEAPEEVKLVAVKLKQTVIINGQRFEPGDAMLPENAYDCWKNAL